MNTPKSTIPGPVGGISLPDARDLQNDTLGYLRRLQADYGDFVKVRIGFWDVFLISHPDGVQHVLLDNWRNYSRDTFQFDQFARVTGRGLLNSTDETWHHHRRLMQPAFHRRHLEEIAAGIKRAVGRLIGRWEEELGPKSEVVVDVDKALLRLALEIIGESLFSLDLTDEAAEWSQELLHLMEYVIYRSQNLLAPPEWVPTGRNRQFRQRMSRLNDRIERLINDRRQGEPQSDLLSLLIDTTGEEGPLSDVDIRDEIVTMIIAGYETVASGMGWILNCLVDHPAVVAELRHELAVTPPTAAGVSAAPLLNGVINEAFRLYPPSWLITRRSLKDDFIEKYLLPAGSLVVISPYLVHRHPDFWSDPELFDPRRFINGSAPDQKMAHIPFGGGPHLCIGKPLAMLEAALTLAGLLPRFHFSRPPGTPAVVPNPQVTLRPQPHLKLKIRRTNDE